MKIVNTGENTGIPFKDISTGTCFEVKDGPGKLLMKADPDMFREHLQEGYGLAVYLEDGDLALVNRDTVVVPKNVTAHVVESW